MSSVDDISGWAERIETLISGFSQGIVTRVVVLESTDSTQDAAIRLAQGRAGLLVVASRQKNGRGTRGRRWDDGDGDTLPCTFALSDSFDDAIKLSAGVACAVHEAVSRFVPRAVRVGIKWPNDIVVCDDVTERKIAGTLIERREGLTLAGIGINCSQDDRDWSPALAGLAVSFTGLGVSVSRLDLLCQLLTSMNEWLVACDEHAIRSYYQEHNAMIGTRRSFRYNQHVIRGVVEHLDPFESIMIRTSTGSMTLPVAQSQHVREESDGDSTTLRSE